MKKIPFERFVLWMAVGAAIACSFLIARQRDRIDELWKQRDIDRASLQAMAQRIEALDLGDFVRTNGTRTKVTHHDPH